MPGLWIDFAAVDVWILRHAKAQDRAASGRDADRALTPDGTRRAEAVGRGLAALSPSIEAILSSPYRRARETAEAAARALGIEEVIESRALEPSRNPSEAASELASNSWGSVLVVGHQPHLGSLVGLLALGDASQEIPLRKSGVAFVSWKPGAPGRLEAFLPPKFLEVLAKKGRRAKA
jgi:phosphohistidine phosphatase